MVAFIKFVEALRQRMQPWIDRLLQWKEASDEWWGLRNERCAMPLMCTRSSWTLDASCRLPFVWLYAARDPSGRQACLTSEAFLQV